LRKEKRMTPTTADILVRYINQLSILCQELNMRAKAAENMLKEEHLSDYEKYEIELARIQRNVPTVRDSILEDLLRRLRAEG
jgi:hypothetical protein